MGAVQGSDSGTGSASMKTGEVVHRKPMTVGEAAGIIFVLFTLVVAWGASAVLIRLLLRATWVLSVSAAPALFLVALIVRNAFRHRRRLRPQRSC